MDPVWSLVLKAPAPGSRSITRQLYGQFKQGIQQGRVAAGQKLPGTRALALSLGVGRNTVIAVYEMLLSEGHVGVRAGAGYTVLNIPVRPAAALPARAGLDQTLNGAYRGLPPLDERATTPRWRHDFRLGLPEKRSLHFEVWRRLSARALRSLGRRDVGYASPQGEPALREAIAAHVSFARAVACNSQQLVVTAGAQQAFDLLARVLVTPGKTVVAVEDPGYPPLRAAFAAAGAVLMPVPVDHEGICVDRVPKDARVICVTPAHQFPLGTVMSLPRRRQLLDHAQRSGAVIIEDDYDGEFRFDHRPLDALQTLDEAQRVFFVGTFSKSLFPALRLGYVVAPPWAVPALALAKQRADWHCNLLAQQTLATFITEGHLARHVRQMLKLYAARRAALLQGIDELLGDWLQPLPGSAGLHLAAQALRPLDGRRVVAHASGAGVRVDSITDYGAGPPGLLFGYGAIDVAAVRPGLRILRQVLDSAAAQTPQRS